MAETITTLSNSAANTAAEIVARNSEKIAILPLEAMMEAQVKARGFAAKALTAQTEAEQENFAFLWHVWMEVAVQIEEEHM